MDMVKFASSLLALQEDDQIIDEAKVTTEQVKYKACRGNFGIIYMLTITAYTYSFIVTRKSQAVL